MVAGAQKNRQWRLTVEAFTAASTRLGEGLYSRSSKGKETARDSSEGMLLAGGQNNGGWKRFSIGSDAASPTAGRKPSTARNSGGGSRRFSGQREEHVVAGRGSLEQHVVGMKEVPPRRLGHLVKMKVTRAGCGNVLNPDSNLIYQLMTSSPLLLNQILEQVP